MLRTLDDVNPDNIQRMIDYVAAAAWIAKTGRHDWRIPHIVAIDAELQGWCDLRVKELARTFRSTRRTMCRAVERLLAADIIRVIGKTPEGRPMYVPNYGIIIPKAGADGE